MLRHYHFTISPSVELSIKATCLDDALSQIEIIFGKSAYRDITTNNDFLSFFISIPD